MLGNLNKRLQRITTNQLYFPEIDGIRFLAIILVIFFHAYGYFLERNAGAFADAGAYPLVDELLKGGNRGVQLFFVLSGFILCLPFAHFYINNGKKVDIKKYYLRRVTRLEPPYFIAMISLFILMIAMKMYTFSTLFPNLLASLAYLHNIFFNDGPFITVVAWSLEIEIQFYLMAPLLFKVLGLPVATRRSILTSAIFLFVFLQEYLPLSVHFIYDHIQYFLAGILLADLYVSNAAPKLLKSGWMGPLALVLFAILLYLPFKTEFYAKLTMPLLILAFYLLALKNDVVKKVFSYKMIPIIGGMCYSIYLLHYPLVSVLGRLTMGIKLTSYYLPNLLLQLVILTIPVLMISAVYYYFIERPFMSSKWLDKLMKKDKKEETINPVLVPEKEVRP
jgi:peptidoglycan/LPS O-acetylase OafA/YrhL